MDFLVSQISHLHEYVWPFVVVGIWILDRRMRKVERLEYYMSRQLKLILRSHHLANGESDDHVRIYPP